MDDDAANLNTALHLNQQQDSTRPQTQINEAADRLNTSSNEAYYGYGMLGCDIINLSGDDGASSDISGLDFDEIHSNNIENKYNSIIEEMTSFKENLGRKIVQF